MPNSAFMYDSAVDVAFYLDEDIDVAIQAALHKRGYDVVTIRDRGNRQAKDAAHMLAAARDGRVFVTHSATDFKLLQEAWHIWPVALQHAGILVMPQQRWLAEEAAEQLDRFVRSGVDLTNELYQWKPSRGWTRYEW